MADTRKGAGAGSGRRCTPVVAAAVVVFIAGCGGGGSSGGGPDGGGGALPPLISAFTPTAGGPGTTVLIEGLLFDPAAGRNTVRFNGAAAVVQSATANEIVAVVPAGATTGPIQVVTSGGSATSSSPFTIVEGSSKPGVSWTTRLSGPTGSLGAVASDGKKFVVVGDSIQVSSDILRWDERRMFVNLGEVAWNGQAYLAVGGSNSTYSSTTGLTWEVRHGTGEDLHGLASSGTLWVAVGDAGTVRTSPDGLTWTTRTAPTAENLRSVAWSGAQFVAVGDRGTIITSPDGQEWTPRTSGTSASFTAVGATSSLMVATAEPYDGAPSAIFTSPDGISWTVRARELPWANAILHAGGRWVLAGYHRVAHSVDGVSWSMSSTTVGSLSGVVYTGSEYVGVGFTGQSLAALYTSPDADRWTLRTSAQSWRALARAATDGRLVAVGTSDFSVTSTDDGATWQYGRMGSNTGNIFMDVEWFPALGAFVAIATEGANQRLHTSVDGLSWTAGAHVRYHGALGASPTTLVNVGANLGGRGIATSPDGVTWTERSSPTSQSLHDVFWTGSQLVGVGSAGTVITSPDGMSWTPRPTGSTAGLHGAVASDTLLVVVGERGTILTSGDGGLSWTARTSGTSATLRSVAWTGEELVAVGGGTAVRSEDGVSWTVQATPYTSVLFGSDPFVFHDLIWSQSGARLVAVGTKGLISTSP